MPEGTRQCNVLLLGASGFIGSHLRAALLAAGYVVTCGARKPLDEVRCRTIEVDYSRDTSEHAWLPRLDGIDIVVNAVGILRETRDASFRALHVEAPAALFHACARAGVSKVVQISALGADEYAVSAYHRSKKQADDVLAALPLPWVIVQPSLVFGHGGTSARLFAGIASLPLIPLPGDGEQLVQPVHIEDLTQLVVRVLGTSEWDGQRLAAVGPEALTLREFLAALRRGMGVSKARFVRVPMTLVRVGAALGNRLPGSLVDRETLAMLVRGNVASAAPITSVLGRAPRPVEKFIEPVLTQTRATEARLTWLLPLLRATVAFVWILTGVVSLGLYPIDESYALLARTALAGPAAAVALYGAALLDLALGVAIFIVRRRQWLWRAQMLLIAAYTVIISVSLPEFWLHPYGPVSKNLPLLAAILLLHELEKPVNG
jgi:uncharacterized protein YbjT (DUF2867 family)